MCRGVRKILVLWKPTIHFLTEDPGVFPDVFPSFLDYVHVGGTLAKEEPRVLLGFHRWFFFSSEKHHHDLRDICDLKKFPGIYE